MLEDRRYWCVVVSKEHVAIGREQGIVQACHGKKHPLVRMKAGGSMVFYSPKKAMNAKEPFEVSLAQALAAIEADEPEKPQWIGQIRFGFFELPKHHFEKIAALMLPK